MATGSALGHLHKPKDFSSVSLPYHLLYLYFVMLSKFGKFLNFVEIGFWNINGIFQNVGSGKVSKLTDEDFLQKIYNLDIFALAETHVGSKQEICVKNFISCSSTRRISKNGRYYGGLTVFVKSIIKPGVKIISLDDPEKIWIKLDKYFFNLDNDIFVAFVYIPPNDSPYLQKWK